MRRQLLTHAAVVLADELRSNLTVLIEDDRIAALDPDHTAGAVEIDLDGRILMPGMIDLHCDALEKDVEPRPGVTFPLDLACAQADRRNAAAGVTTVFHALSFANQEFGVRNNQVAAQIGRAIHGWQPHALIDNKFHARFEVNDPTAQPILSDLLDEGAIDLISFMDHSPGQGQFRDVESFRRYIANVYEANDTALDAIIEQKAKAAPGATARMQQLAAQARACNVAIASHDDDTEAKIAIVGELGATISEFPINLETALVARARGMSTMFGAPNILRGKSQSGNMRAVDAVKAEVADCLCSDYSPASLLPAVMKLPELAEISLARAVAFVTRNPARAAGLRDRGEIAAGKRADLVAVQRVGNLPHPGHVWSRGRLALAVSQARQ